MVAGLLVLVLLLPKGIAALVYALLMAIGAYELLYGTGLVKHSRLVLYSCVMAFAVTLWSYYNAVQAYLYLLLLAFTVALFCEMMVDHVKVRLSALAECYLGGFLVPFLLSAVIRILALKIGRYMVLIPFVVAFLSDSGAYFAGRFFGRHKLAPVISQHKTVEGAIGGVITAIAGMIIYCLVLHLGFNLRVNYLFAIIYGLLGSCAGVFGDLCFSIIKRQTGIKDYGNLIPGHGGVLDRFDSMMMVGPLMEALLILIPLAV